MPGGAWEGPAWWKEKRMIFEAVFRPFAEKRMIFEAVFRPFACLIRKRK